MAKIGIIGAGYAGLAAAYELRKRDHSVTVFESSKEVGGLAGSFEIEPNVRLEKFYHHWFTSDTAIFDLVKELGIEDQLSYKESNNGLFYANSIFRLSSPLELLSFKPIPFLDRVRTGIMALYARQLEDWMPLENISAAEWIQKVGGKKGYETIWKPLLKGKFGNEADNISAVWFWNKLKLRGSSRGKGSKESLVYYKGGFGALTDSIADKLLKLGVEIKLSEAVKSLVVDDQVCKGVVTTKNKYDFDQVLATVPLPEYLKLYSQFPDDYVKRCDQIRFLGNICLVLILNQSLSSTYWLNIADPEFPFVGVIEHTNFDDKSNYGGNHIAYLSKYLPTSDKLFNFTNEQFFEYCTPYLQKLFPEFSTSWVKKTFLWKANYSQPVITLNYSSFIPETKTPLKNLWLSTMAQIYPEDRGTNYAVKHGREVARQLAGSI